MTRPLQVLVVDDDPMDLLLAQDAFGRLKHPTVITTATSAEETLCLLEDARWGQPDLIVLDIQMPEMDGLELLTRLKADVNLRNIPVVMLTVSDDDDHITRAYHEYASAYFVKKGRLDLIVAQFEMMIGFWSSAKTIRDRR